MLLKIREATAGKFSYFIVAIISVPFALWGINYYFQGGFDPVVAEVGSSEITMSQFNAAFNQKKRDLEARLDSSQIPSDHVIRNSVVGDLVRERLLERDADQYNYYIPDVVLAQKIIKTPEFFTDGKFDKERYLNTLSAQRQSQSNFEENTRNWLRKSQLQRVIIDSEFTLPYEQAAYETFFFQERKLRYVEFPVERYIRPGSISSTRVSTYFEENKDKFVSSDEFNLKYIELNVEEIADDFSVEEDKLHSYFENNSDLFSTPEQRRLAHILFDPDLHDEDEFEKLSQDIYDRLKQGEDFAELAKMYSDDSLTAEKSGELPLLAREDIDSDIAEVVFALESGDFSEPIESDFGLQIFKLIAVEPALTQSFEEVREVIEDQIKHEMAENIYNEAAEQMETFAYEFSDSLELVAERMEMEDGVKSVESLDITKHESLFQYPEIRDAVYTERVLKDAENSPLLEVGEGHAFVIRVDSGAYKPGRQKMQDEVESEIVEILLKDDAWIEASAKVDEWAKRLEESEITFDKLAEEQLLTIHETEFIRRDSEEVPFEIAGAGFLMPEIIGSYIRTRINAAQSYGLIELLGVRKGEFSEEEKPRGLMGHEEFNGALLGMLEKTGVEIHQDKFNDDQQ